VSLENTRIKRLARFSLSARRRPPDFSASRRTVTIFCGRSPTEAVAQLEDIAAKYSLLESTYEVSTVSNDPLQHPLVELRTFLLSQIETHTVDSRALVIDSGEWNDSIKTSIAFLVAMGYISDNDVIPGKISLTSKASSLADILAFVDRLLAAPSELLSNGMEEKKNGRAAATLNGIRSGRQASSMSPLDVQAEEEALDDSNRALDAEALYSHLWLARAFTEAAMRHSGPSSKTFPSNRFCSDRFSDEVWKEIVICLHRLKLVRVRPSGTVRVAKDAGQNLRGLLRRVDTALCSLNPNSDSLVSTSSTSDSSSAEVQKESRMESSEWGEMEDGMDNEKDDEEGDDQMLSAEQVEAVRDLVRDSIIASGSDSPRFPPLSHLQGYKQRMYKSLLALLHELRLVYIGRTGGHFVVETVGNGDLGSLHAHLRSLLHACNRKGNAIRMTEALSMSPPVSLSEGPFSDDPSHSGSDDDVYGALQARTRRGGKSRSEEQQQGADRERQWDPSMPLPRLDDEDLDLWPDESADKHSGRRKSVGHSKRGKADGGEQGNTVTKTKREQEDESDMSKLDEEIRMLRRVYDFVGTAIKASSQSASVLPSPAAMPTYTGEEFSELCTFIKELNLMQASYSGSVSADRFGSLASVQVHVQLLLTLLEQQKQQSEDQDEQETFQPSFFTQGGQLFPDASLDRPPLESASQTSYTTDSYAPPSFFPPHSSNPLSSPSVFSPLQAPQKETSSPPDSDQMSTYVQALAQSVEQLSYRVLQIEDLMTRLVIKVGRNEESVGTLLQNGFSPPPSDDDPMYEL